MRPTGHAQVACRLGFWPMEKTQFPVVVRCRKSVATMASSEEPQDRHPVATAGWCRRAARGSCRGTHDDRHAGRLHGQEAAVDHGRGEGHDERGESGLDDDDAVEEAEGGAERQ